MTTLTSSIADIPGVSRTRAAIFRRLGIHSVADLIRHLPMRYEHELPEQSIADAGEAVGPKHGATANITVRGEVMNTRHRTVRTPRFEATIFDGSASILLTWFNARWMKGKLHPGATIRATGKAKRWGDYLQLINPQWEIIEPEGDARDIRAERYRPIYPATEDLPSAAVEAAIDAVLDDVLPLIADHLPDHYRQRRALPPLAESYRMIHRPGNESEHKTARRRLAFDELLMLQIAVMLKRHHRRETLSAPMLKHNEAIDRHICDRFPFELTKSQRAVIDDVVSDVTTAQPMNRLLQGDVGAGKTVIALYAMLLAVASGHQSAMMAPTELLAEQHYGSIRGMLSGATVSIELLTGSLKKSARDEMLNRLREGEIDILVGTHALLTESVDFRSLGIAVIDEQHRFGVHQRATMRAKSTEPDTCPHMLVMTATPIPRTLSLTVFGDLDVSTINELPPGREPVITKHVAQAQAGEVYEYLARRLAGGDQAYIVVPAIDESEMAVKDVHSHLAYLGQGPLSGRTLAALHGRLKRQERDEIMNRFRGGKIDALVATTVIEVGVDVPNATIMVIEHAERFGLAQLHQLRGRVGRGSRRSLCVLIGDPTTEEGAARLDAIISSSDGFVIAERDLEIRGPGELFGARQSGVAPFLAATLPRDLALLRMARRDAVEWVKKNPTLSGEENVLLRKRLLKAHGESLGLGDVG